MKPQLSFGEDVGRCIMDTAHKIKLGLNSIFEKAGLNGLQARIIGFVKFNSSQGVDIYQKDIETEFKIRRSSVSSVLDTMEKNGFIRRQSVTDDARLKKIVLTEKADSIADEHHKTVLRFEKSLLENLTTQEISILKELLNKVEQNIDNQEV